MNSTTDRAHWFGFLKAPIRRVTCPDVPTPAAYTLEEAFYTGAEDIARAVREILD